jgi:hypothetical protein
MKGKKQAILELKRSRQKYSQEEDTSQWLGSQVPKELTNLSHISYFQFFNNRILQGGKFYFPMGIPDNNG